MIMKKILTPILILAFIIICVLIFTNKGNNVYSKFIEFFDFKTYNYYHGFPLPFNIEETEIDDSLFKDKSINIDDHIGFRLPEKITKKAEENGWKKSSEEKYLDGGSLRLRYDREVDEPAVEMFYFWDMVRGAYVGVTINFIYPSSDKFLIK